MNHERKREVAFVEMMSDDDKPISDIVDVADDVDIDVAVDNASRHENSDANSTKFLSTQYIQAPKLSSTSNPLQDFAHHEYDEFAIDPKHYMLGHIDDNLFSPPHNRFSLNSSFMQTPNSVRGPSTESMNFPSKPMLSPTPDLLQLHQLHAQQMSPSISYPFSMQYPGNACHDNTPTESAGTPVTQPAHHEHANGNENVERVNLNL
eukprot:CAMPEP_0202732728 /NCGR_PEP_ID=MMETSP1385-20130828/187810_1 /ASSEMBLY_ACC=CAM_ASM_000861 /TAXON_ID=933848 /ORGANISM="Elphidium margaritaceum" /LENGTH=205 /DNA_ID=CAMNT_0049399051 /DNA_START=520 /DNA_END=1137 /DNA_ORIENTATION=-